MIAQGRLKFDPHSSDMEAAAPRVRGPQARVPVMLFSMVMCPPPRRAPAGLRGGWRRQARRACLAALLALLALLGPSGRAWDANRMLQAAQAAGPRALNSVRALQRVLQSVNGAEDEAQLAAVNEFFNRAVLFAEDAQAWGTVDHWASPIETLARGQGDCEDYAIAKYFSLVALGMPAAKLRLVYVRVQTGGLVQAHMVLAYYPAPQAEPMVLDNLIPDIRSASRRPDLTPVFSFNSEGLWQGTGGASAGDPTARLSRWREVLQKVRAEGFL